MPKELAEPTKVAEQESEKREEVSGQEEAEAERTEPEQQDVLDYAFSGVDALLCCGGSGQVSKKEDDLDAACNAVEAASCGSADASPKQLGQEVDMRYFSEFSIAKENEDDKLGIAFRNKVGGKVILTRANPEGLCSDMKVGDEIVSINGTTVESKEQMQSLIKEAGLKIDIVTRPVIAPQLKESILAEALKAKAPKEEAKAVTPSPKAETPKKKKKRSFWRRSK